MTDTPDEKQTTVASNNKYNNSNNNIPIEVPLDIAPPRDKQKDFVQDYYMMSTAMCCKVAGKVGIYIYSYLKWRKGMDKNILKEQMPITQFQMFSHTIGAISDGKERTKQSKKC